MRARFLMCLTILCWCSLSACTTMQPVTTQGATSQEDSKAMVEELSVGDSVSLKTSDGVTHNLTVVAIDDEVLRGQSCDGCSFVTIPVNSIEELHVEKLDVVKSGGVGAGVIVAVVLVIALIAGPGFSPGL